MTYNLMPNTTDGISFLTDNDKIIFIKTLAHMARLDGHVDKEEISQISNLAQQFGFDINQIEDFYAPCDENEIITRLKTIKNRRTALLLIKELCFLGHADSNLSPEEVLFIGHVGEATGIEIKKIEQISDWVVDNIILQEKGKFIFEND